MTATHTKGNTLDHIPANRDELVERYCYSSKQVSFIDSTNNLKKCSQFY